MFCIEHYNKEKILPDNEAAEVLGQYGVFDYLAEHYEMLHTQSRQWLMEDIDEIISLRSKEVV